MLVWKFHSNFFRDTRWVLDPAFWVVNVIWIELSNTFIVQPGLLLGQTHWCGSVNLFCSCSENKTTLEKQVYLIKRSNFLYHLTNKHLLFILLVTGEHCPLKHFWHGWEGSDLLSQQLLQQKLGTLPSLSMPFWK